MQRQPTTHFTYEQYAAMEALATERSEYVDGQIFAMAGTTPRHNEIMHNIRDGIRACLESKGCRVYPENVRTLSPGRTFSAYPDIMIVWGKPVMAISDPNAIVNPMVIVEVQSPSTADDDRHTKFAEYRHIPTLVEFVIVSQEKPSVEIYRKLERDGWPLPQPIAHGEAEIAGCVVSLDQIYRALPG